jgi:MHS family proline/betaine transporter-like MFS transporter
MVQGLSVGGEYTTSVVFLVEGAAPERRGLAGSWSAFGAVAGILLGSAVGALVTTVLSDQAVHAWGWRLPFVFGLGVGLAGLFIRKHLPETAAASAPEPAGSPVLQALRTQWRAMLQIAGLNVLNAVGFYMAFVYVVTYLKEVMHFSAAEALDINTVNMVLLLVMIPLFGHLSDRLGRKSVLLFSTVGTLLCAWPLFWLMHHPSFALALLGQMGFAVLIGAFLGAIPVTMVEAFPGQVRCSGLSIAYNLCLGIIGGTTPMVTTYLLKRTGDDLSPAYFMMAAAAVSLAFLFTLLETHKKPLN